MTRFRVTSLLIAVTIVTAISQLANAQEKAPELRETPRSTCMAMSDNWWPQPGYEDWRGNHQYASPPVQKASVTAQALSDLIPSEARITYVAHSTFRIEDATGLKIATDYAGFAGPNVVPDVVTMNHAHATHFTIAPDQRIPHVLPGWGKDGEPAHYNLQIGETIIRNVTTDINNQWAGYEPDGNSIFIFEMAGLCIGHLGRLHHLLRDQHYAEIGRLDVLMVPVDGGHTMSVEEMAMVVSRLQASVILPMHWFGEGTLQRFLSEVRGRFPVERLAKSSLTISLNTLPAQPTVTVLLPEGSLGIYDD